MATVALNVDDAEGFTFVAPYKTEALLRSIARGPVVEGVDNMERAREAEGVIEERAPEDVAVLVVDAGRGVKEVFIFIDW
jgi:hypothetical protein